MKKRIRTLLCAAVLLLLPAMECAADADVRDSYTYTNWGDAEPLPDLYEAQRVIRAEDSGLLPFKEPQDLFVDARHGNKVYVADTGRTARHKRSAHRWGCSWMHRSASMWLIRAISARCAWTRRGISWRNTGSRRGKSPLKAWISFR